MASAVVLPAGVLVSTMAMLVSRAILQDTPCSSESAAPARAAAPLLLLLVLLVERTPSSGNNLNGFILSAFGGSPITFDLVVA